MKKCMILLTSEYPFATMETFIESEMQYHENNFDKIIVLAVAAEKDSPKTRKTSDNIDCYNLTTKNKKVTRLSEMVNGVFHSLKKNNFSEMDKTEIGRNPIKRFFLEYFLERSENEYKLCSAALKKYDFSEYDDVVIYSYWFFVTAMIGIKLKSEIQQQCKKVKLISRAHGYDLYAYANAAKYLPIRKYLLENVDKVYSCSIDGKEYLKNKYPEYSQKIECSYLGAAKKGDGYRSDNGLSIVSCSSVDTNKRVIRIAQSLALMKDSGVDNIKWTHFGDGDELNEIRKYSEENLDFIQTDFKGRVTNDEIYKYYTENAVDVFINVSLSEGLPVSIMEAMSFGIPVIATDVGGSGEIVKDGSNGFLLSDDFKNDDLASLLIKIENSDDIEMLRRNAKRSWNTYFNAANNYSEFSELISK